MQAKVEQAWTADKLAKRQARTPEVAVQSAFSALQSRKAAMAGSQTKIKELGAAAKQAAEAVEEVKKKAEKIARGDRQATDSIRRGGGAPLSGPRTLSHISRTPYARLSRPFLEISKPSLSSLSWKQLSQAFPGCWRLQTPTPMATDLRGDIRLAAGTKRRPSRARHWPSPGLLSVHWKACPRTSERPRRRRLWSTSRKRGTFSHLKRHINTVYCALQPASSLRQGTKPLNPLTKILVGEGLPVRESHQKTSWTITTANVTT